MVQWVHLPASYVSLPGMHDAPASYANQLGRKGAGRKYTKVGPPFLANGGVIWGPYKKTPTNHGGNMGVITHPEISGGCFILLATGVWPHDVGP